MTGSVRTCCGCRSQVPDGDIRLLVGPPPVTSTGPRVSTGAVEYSVEPSRDEHLHSARTRALNGLLGFLSIKGVRRTGPVSWTIYFGRDSRVVASCPALVQEGA